MWESPVDIIYDNIREIQEQVVEEHERTIVKAIQSYGIMVDKDELVRALMYDRQQYEKGYADAKAEHQWIPCSERSPEESGRYLVTRGLNSCGNLWNRVYIVNYSDFMGLKAEKIWWSGRVGKSDFEKHEDVHAWMPLPEPYKAEE